MWTPWVGDGSTRILAMRPALLSCSRMRWEYLTVSIDAHGWFLGGKLDADALTGHLNKLGEDGWEATTAFDTNMAHGQTRSVYVLLKRPRDAR